MSQFLLWLFCLVCMMGCGSNGSLTTINSSPIGSNLSPNNNLAPTASEEGTPSRTALVTFTSKDGDVFTVEAIQGKVLVILVDRTLLPDVAASGATVDFQEGPLLVLNVPAGQEARVIDAMHTSARVSSAWPSLPVVSAQTGPPGPNPNPPVLVPPTRIVDKRAIDDTQVPTCRTTHGNAVKEIMGLQDIYDLADNGRKPRTDDLLKALFLESARGPGFLDNRPRVINMSQFTGHSPGLADLKVARDAVRAYYTSLFDALSRHGGLEDTVIVLSAGNGFYNGSQQGMDVGPLLKALFTKHPDLKGHVVIVGGSGRLGGPCQEQHNFHYSSESSEDSGFIYAPSDGVPIPGFPDCQFNGTSAAAPLVSNALADAIAPSTGRVADIVNKFVREHRFLNCGTKITPHTGRMKITRTEVWQSGANRGWQGERQMTLQFDYHIEPDRTGTSGTITYPGGASLTVDGKVQDLTVGGSAFNYYYEWTSRAGAFTGASSGATYISTPHPDAGKVYISVGGTMSPGFTQKNYYKDPQTGLVYNETSVPGDAAVGFTNRNGTTVIAPPLELTTDGFLKAQTRSYSFSSSQITGDPSYGNVTLTHSLQVF